MQRVSSLPICAIHSRQQKLTSRSAARLAMKFLKSGGTAVDAVEAAIKCLEDKEITNAGFGSNLSIDGIVEGDATIVDHLGRSGACGSAQSMYSCSLFCPTFAVLKSTRLTLHPNDSGKESHLPCTPHLRPQQHPTVTATHSTKYTGWPWCCAVCPGARNASRATPAAHFKRRSG